MNAGLVVIFGAIIGFACYCIYGSGFGLWRDIALGIGGFILSSSAASVLYFVSNFGGGKIIGINWYSLTVGTIGAVAMVYGGLLYKKVIPTLRIKKLIHK